MFSLLGQVAKLSLRKETLNSMCIYTICSAYAMAGETKIKPTAFTCAETPNLTPTQSPLHSVTRKAVLSGHAKSVSSGVQNCGPSFCDLYVILNELFATDFHHGGTVQNPKQKTAELKASRAVASGWCEALNLWKRFWRRETVP